VTGPGSPPGLARSLEAKASELGFGLFGITGAEPTAHMPFYESWIGDGLHGEMAYLARPESVERRSDLDHTMAGVRSVIVVGHEYAPAGSDGDGQAAAGDVASASDPGRAVIARYARGVDYHTVIKKKLRRLLTWLDGAVPGGVRGRPYVDTGPILERDLGRRAGLGWFGRNTMLISPRRGSYFFLGVLLVDVPLPASPPFEFDRCGSCSACVEACPTEALLGRNADGAPVLDARRCVSYLTIELRGVIPSELRPGLGNHVFGCDVCQEVCPFTRRFSRATREESYAARPELSGPDGGAPALLDLAERLLSSSEEDFARDFRGSPLKRARREGLLRNVCVALGNWGSEDATAVLERALEDRSELVREHARWALERVVRGVASGEA
jgi:epoxyqueuosine reductase